jgi:hypothetical protein
MAATNVAFGAAIGDRLGQLIKAKGSAVCENETLVRSYLYDFFPPESPAVNLVITALRENVPRDLLEGRAQSAIFEMVVGKCEERIVKSHFTDRLAARWAVLCWSVALGQIDTPEMDRLLKTSTPAEPVRPADGPGPVQKPAEGGVLDKRPEPVLEPRAQPKPPVPPPQRKVEPKPPVPPPQRKVESKPPVPPGGPKISPAQWKTVFEVTFAVIVTGGIIFIIGKICYTIWHHAVVDHPELGSQLSKVPLIDYFWGVIIISAVIKGLSRK